jgi:hypothetical protein
MTTFAKRRWRLAALAALTAAAWIAALSMLSFTQKLATDLSIHPDALLPQLDPIGDAASMAHQDAQAREEARVAALACRRTGVGDR